MDELRDRIARTLTDHRYLYATKSVGGVREEFCTCGWSTDLKFAAWEDFARHQADAVIEALGLTEEPGHTFYGVNGPCEGVTPGPDPLGIQTPHYHRYVTPWKETP